jgi:hypothetical protein
MSTAVFSFATLSRALNEAQTTDQTVAGFSAALAARDATIAARDAAIAARDAEIAALRAELAAAKNGQHGPPPPGPSGAGPSAN